MLTLLKKLFFKKGNKKHNFEEMIGSLATLLTRQDLIRSSIYSRKQGEFKGNPMNKLSLREKISILPILLTNIRELKKSYKGLDTVSQKKEITEAELMQLMQKAKDLGVLSLGFTKVKQDDIFEGYGILYPYTIVFSIEMDKVRISKAPSFDTLITVQETYAETGIIANKLAEFIRKMGFAAQAGPGLGGLTIYPVLAESAGMGYFGRHGLIITPEAGPRHRLAVVYTNIENLPLSKENPHKWIQEFCKECGRCIKKCPAQAIHNTPVKTKGENIEYIDNDICVTYFAQNYGCSVCVKECPFNQMGYDEIRKRFQNNITS